MAGDIRAAVLGGLASAPIGFIALMVWLLVEW